MSAPDVVVSPSSAGVISPGTVYLVGAGPGDPDLITVRGAELLSLADVIFHDELVHPALLSRARAGAEVRYVGKRGGDPASKRAAQDAIDEALVVEAKKGRRVVRLKGGDPFLFGRGSEEAEVLARAGVPFEVVPGVPSPLGATAYAGISITHRDLASSVTFLSGTTRAGAPFDFRELAGHRGTLCVLMGMRRLRAITEALVRDAGRDPSTPAVVIERGTWASQRVVEGSLGTIAERAIEAGLQSPAIVVVGSVVELRSTLRWFDARPLFGKRVLVTRPEGQAASTAELVRRRGGEPITMPSIVLGPPADPARVTEAARSLASYDLVAFTSENAVAAIFRELDAMGLDARAFGRARLAAIGPGTAASLAMRGLRADIVPSAFRGEELATAILADPALIAAIARGSARALIPRAKVAREVLPESLREAGCHVDVVPVYETHAAPAALRDDLVVRLEKRGIDVIMLTSSSTADSLADMLGARAAELLRDVLLASIGPITTATAHKRGLTVAVTANESTVPGLIRAMEDHLAKRS